MWLIAGLGNPGAGYAQHRHNAGFMAIDAIASRCGASVATSAHKAQLMKATLANIDCILAKPQTFMNLSGESLQAIGQYYKIPPAQMLVLHDDLDLKFAQLRIKKGGGHGGHNGLRDIDARLGKEYWRLRIGIGHPRDSATPQMEVSDYVLQRFSADEQRKLTQITALIAGNVDLFFTESPEAMLREVMQELKKEGSRPSS